MDLRNIRLREDDAALVILDQTRLPGKVEFLELTEPVEFYDAIKKLRVRGAPAIGIFAAYAFFVRASRLLAEDKPRGESSGSMDAFRSEMRGFADYLNSSRPTAVNLSWALKRMYGVLAGFTEADGSPDRGSAGALNATRREELLQSLKNEALAIHEEDKKMCRAISEYGLSLLKDGSGILTHCNAGPLATSEYGTGLGPLILGAERGYSFHAFVDETRPLLQGARLTAFELQNAGIDTTLICDNMASIVMKQGRIDAVLVGTDRIAKNGDIANKIGTSGAAVLAKYYGIPFYVLGPSSTVDPSCPDGEHIPIELRDPDEIKAMWYEKPMAPEGVKAYNPSFDVTSHELITAIITEKGIFRPPFDFGFSKKSENYACNTRYPYDKIDLDAGL